MNRDQEAEQNDVILFCFFVGSKMNGMVCITFFLQMIKKRVSSFPRGKQGEKHIHIKRGFHIVHFT
jgi:hypothetical protein